MTLQSFVRAVPTLMLGLLALPALTAAPAAAQGVQTRPPNAPDQKPAIAGQTRAPEQKLNVAFEVVTVAEGLQNPWSVAFLPGGKMLVTERPGRLRVVSADGKLSEPVAGLPAVLARGQGGLLDVALDPGFADNQLIYWSFSEPREDGTNNTAVARGRFVDDAAAPRVENVEVIYHQAPSMSSNAHFGSRLVFGRDGTLLVTQGDRSITPGRMQAQNLDSGIGKVVRINRDGSIPKDNPFVGRERPARDLSRSASATSRRPPCTPPPANSGRSSTARAAATRSTSSARAGTTAGRPLPTASSTRAARSPGASPRKREWSSRSTTGTRSSARAA